jgi:hypothetical protein
MLLGRKRPDGRNWVTWSWVLFFFPPRKSLVKFIGLYVPKLRAAICGIRFIDALAGTSRHTTNTAQSATVLSS